MKQEKQPIGALTLLQQLLDSSLKEVNALILEHAQNNASSLIPEITEYIASAGGKRIRPILTLASSLLFGAVNEKAILLATAVEYIHTATLLHDDVVDESTSRRGRAPANHKWSNKSAILVGDFLFAQAFQLMVKTDNLTALAALSQAAAIIAEGEVVQLENIENQQLTTAQYYDIIISKTASLFAAACAAGAIVTDANIDEINAVREYGLNLGILFQIVDDILDYNANDKQFGKQLGKDFVEKKITLPLIKLLSYADKEDKAQLLFCLSDDEDTSKNFAIVLDLMHKYNVFAACMQECDIFIEKAILAVGKLPNSQLREIFVMLLHEIKTRSY